MFNVLKVFVVMCFSVILVLSGCGVPKSEHQILEEKYEKVQKEITEFTEQAKKVQEQNSGLIANSKALEVLRLDEITIGTRFVHVGQRNFFSYGRITVRPNYHCLIKKAGGAGSQLEYRAQKVFCANSS